MYNMLKETKYLYNNLLKEHQKRVIDEVLSKIDEDMDEDILNNFWEIDGKIEGIDGYNMSKNPVMNLFPGGVNRLMFSRCS